MRGQLLQRLPGEGDLRDIDMLISALAVRHELAIFTTDTDFVRYARILPLKLHPVRTAREFGTRRS